MSTSTDLSSLTGYPAGDLAWMHERGLSPVLMEWVNPEPADEHLPIEPDLWAGMVAHLPRLSGSWMPDILTVAHKDDERLVMLEAATLGDLRQALTTSLVTACRLHEELMLELSTAAALIDALQGGEAG